VSEPLEGGFPPKLGERAREIAAGRLSPAVPHDAATVMLLRQDPGVEAYLLRRTRELDFAPGVCVFPGGSVDEQDADPQIAWTGPGPAEFAGQLGTSQARARALICAAVRETFEEAGVLLAGPSPTSLVDDSAALARDRHSLLEGSTSFGELLSRRGLMLRADLLTPWARWITPEASPRRFDTWFFAAALPPGQTAGLVAGLGQANSGESDSGTWLQPGAALESARAGQITLLPPTVVTLGELAAHEELTGILSQRRVIAARMPTVMTGQGRVWLAMPPLDPQAGDHQAGDQQP
jgi:8-oxo-dGTP pyrophosphatase MutT (NUDIX family)